jgi:Leucine-rich repeat (LRR) protein
MDPRKSLKDPRRTSISQDTFFHKYNTYCCPSCSALPEIISYNEVNGIINLECKKHGNMNIEIQDYFDKMKKWEGKSDIKLKNKCTEHNEKYAYFCLNCKENICEKCFKDEKHESHIKYNINSLSPNNAEISVLKEKISLFLLKKDELLMNLKELENKITFYDTLISSYERQAPNYFLNINLKHLLYGEKFNLDNVKNAENIKTRSKKDIFDDFIKKNFMKATEGLKQLTLINKNIDDDFMEDLIKGIGVNNSVYQILRFDKQIKGPEELINLKVIKLLNLRGNKISSLNFMSGKDFPFLELLSLNDNEINSIEELKNFTCPDLKELYLSKNKIKDINVLSQLKIKKLRILWLSNNNIESINVFQKVDFPHLIKLGLNKNNIKDINVFSKKRTKFPMLYELYLNNNEIDKIAFSDILKDLYHKIKEFYY